jgi:hypothetical protein
VADGRLFALRQNDAVYGIEGLGDGQRDPLNEGLEQLDHYLSGLGLETGWLVIFDQRRGLPDISERTTTGTAVTPTGRAVIVIRG